MRRRPTQTIEALALLGCLTIHGGCNVTDEDVQSAVNNAAQDFINSLFAQWLGVKVDAVFDVD